MTDHGPVQAGALAPRRTPEAHVRAEITAWPLVSEQAFRSGLVGLDPDLAARGPTALLWRDCEQHLAQQTGGWSLDRMVAARDRTWFQEERGVRAAVPLHAYLRKLAHDHVEALPGLTAVRQSTDVSAMDAHAHYRWLTFALPEDLVLAAVDAAPPPRRVEIDPPLLVRRLLDRGVAEIHQHLGAGMDFPLLWEAALAALAGPAIAEAALAGPGAPFGGGHTLVRWLLAAAVARVMLAELLVRGAKQGGLAAFVHAPSASPAWHVGRRRVLAAAIIALRDGDERALPDFFDLRDLYRDLHPSALDVAERPPCTVDDAQRRCDPITVRLRLEGPGAGERWLVTRALAHLEALGERRAPADALFAPVFWQMIRIRCQYYRAIVQRPLTAGLQWFIRFYGRIGALRDPLDRVRVEASYRTAGRDEPVAALELRAGVDPSPFVLAEELRGFVRSWGEVLARDHGVERTPEIGVVLHFIKQRGSAWNEGRPQAFWRETSAAPTGGGRFDAMFADQAARAQSIVTLLEAIPSALWLLRGIDVASDELAVPTWVMAPLFHHVRAASLRASVRVAAEGAPPLGITAHVGEDFRHLMEGLRRVFECMTYLLPPLGGRLGHATALGVEPRHWAESVGSVLVPVEERLLDLLFEWRLYARYRVMPELVIEAPPGRPAAIEHRIRDLSHQILGRSFAPQELAEAYDAIHRLLLPPVPALGGGLPLLRRRARALPSPVSTILAIYLERPEVFARGQQLIDVMVDGGEIAALVAVQNTLRGAVGARGLVVEVNPSSNLLIGDMLDLRNHPVLRLHPPEPIDHVPPVPIAIGSDDPVTFSTHLVREYTLLHQAARAAGYPERTVHEWLESIRRTGMDARFTVAWRPTSAARAEQLETALGDFAQIPRAERRRRG